MSLLPINDLDRHFAPIRQELEAAIGRVLTKGWFVLGPEVKAFEEEFSRFTQTSQCVSVANGSDALEIGLKCLDVGLGTRVATVANAGAYSSLAIRALGAEPAYVEVDPDRLTMDPGALEKSLASGNTRAVVVTHLYGRIADMPEIMKIADRYQVPVLEDCAQAHGAAIDGKPVGSWGRLGSFSFYPTKNLGALGDGGALVTSAPEIADTARQLRQYGWSTKYHVSRQGGRNSRLDELQAAVLRAMLPLLPKWNQRRMEIGRIYDRELAGQPFHIPRLTDGQDVVHLYVCKSPHRDQFREGLAGLGVACDFHYPVPDHFQPGLGIARKPALPLTESWCAQTFSLPCFPEMTDEEVIAVAEKVRMIAEGLRKQWAA